MLFKLKYFSNILWGAITESELFWGLDSVEQLFEKEDEKYDCSFYSYVRNPHITTTYGQLYEESKHKNLQLMAHCFFLNLLEYTPRQMQKIRILFDLLMNDLLFVTVDTSSEIILLRTSGSSDKKAVRFQVWVELNQNKMKELNQNKMKIQNKQQQPVPTTSDTNDSSSEVLEIEKNSSSFYFQSHCAYCASYSKFSGKICVSPTPLLDDVSSISPTPFCNSPSPSMQDYSSNDCSSPTQSLASTVKVVPPVKASKKTFNLRNKGQKRKTKSKIEKKNIYKKKFSEANDKTLEGVAIWMDAIPPQKIFLFDKQNCFRYTAEN